MTFRTMTIGDLRISPFNCRTDKTTATRVAGLAASIRQLGLLYPLVVHPMDDGAWGVLAGQRRFNAIALLEERGEQWPGYPAIDVIVRDALTEGELEEISLAENAQRVDLYPYELYAATARAHAAGRSIAELADANGQDHGTVRGWIRLGNLHPTVFAALESRIISSAQARAFGATDDQALQLWAFEQWQKLPEFPPYSRSPDVIRHMLHVGNQEEERMLAYVGEPAYRAAGGRYDLDLFAEDAQQRGRVTDPALLRRMVDEKLNRRKTLLRRQLANHAAGRELRFETAYPKDELRGIATDLEIVVEAVPATPADAERLAFIEDEIVELTARAQKVVETMEEGAERDAAIAALDVDFVPLETEERAIHERMTLPLPDGDIFATAQLDDEGREEVRFWFASRKAKKEALNGKRGKPVAAGPIGTPIPAPAPADKLRHAGSAIDATYHFHDRRIADAAIKDDTGLTAEGVNILRSVRREVMRAGMVTDAEIGGTVATDFVLWALARFELTGGESHKVGARRLGGSLDRHDPLGAEEHLRRTEAHLLWKAAIADAKKHASMADPDLGAAFAAFMAAGDDFKRHVGALVAGFMVERSANADGYRVAVHDVLAQALELNDATVRAYVEPTEEMVALFPKAQRIALARPHVDDATFRSWGQMSASQLLGPVTRALKRAAAWTHPIISFGLRAAPVEAPATEESQPA